MLHIICQYLVCWTHVVFYYRTAGQIASGEFKEGLNAVEWDDETREKLQTVVDESNQVAFCGDNEVC